ncbi:MAG TPA: helix-turn-helix domain-containing protein [Candidatus Anammoximicrobium sp.]|nr:helix-turn-helix domain-containing protein [Candidatus Anammoximicrobium sp.]
MARSSRIPPELRAAWDATEPAPEPDADREGRGQDRPKGKAAGRKAADRFAVLNNFVDFTAATLNRAELLVWLTLYRDTRDGTAATSQADIARRTGLCKRTVQLTTARLEAAKLLKRVHRGGLRRGTSRYRVFGLRKDTA